MNGGPVVLAVDDDESILAVVAWALEEEGYEVRLATDGEAALAIMHDLVPAVIIVDMRLPGMNGCEFVAAYAARDGRRAPVVVMTAAQDSCQLAREIGAEGCLGKPFDVDTLVQTVRQYAPSR